MARSDFSSRFAHLDTDVAKERDGVEAGIEGSDIVVMVRRAGGRNYGFEKHASTVREKWKRTHGTKPLAGEDLRTFNRDVFAHCIAGWNEDAVGMPYSAEAARELIELESVYEKVLEVSSAWQNYRKAALDLSKEIAGNA